MSQTQRNEGKCCDAVLRVLEHRLNTQRADLHVPDRADRTEKRVDLCARLGANRYVLEHTRIDPFEEAVTISAHFSDFVTPIEERLSGVLPGPALHSLLLPQDQRFDRGGRGIRKRTAKAQADVVEWVSDEAPRLYQQALAAGLYFRHVSAVREFPNMWTVHLNCTLTGPPSETVTGDFRVDRTTNYDPEEQRFKRLPKALAGKCPKLQRCKERGARTVLVLEDDNIADSNSVVVREALNRVAEERTDLPDEIYLVETKVNTWHMWPMNSAADACFPRDFDIECKNIESMGLDDLMCKRNSSFQCDVCLGH